MSKKFKKLSHFLSKNRFLVVVWIIFLFELFLRFYQIQEKNPFGYDQVDNAWAAKNIIINHWYPLVGMVAKGNSGIYIGPAYYYLVAIFYWFTNLSPIASGLLAGATSIFSFWVIYFVTSRIINREVALIAIIINTFNFNAIYFFDRIQWPVNFIPAVSLLIFYFLYRVTQGEVKKLIPLAIAVGFMFHIHFTAVFFPIIILLSIPLFPRTRETIKYALISLPFFLIWLLPNAIYMLVNKSASGTSYFENNYHGFHLKRAYQIVGDAFIQFNHFLLFDNLIKFKLFIPIIFLIVYIKRTKAQDKFKLIYLIALWFLVPWAIFTTYSGEISDYYFATTRFIALLMLSYLIYSVWALRNIIAKVFVAALIGAYAIYNFIIFFPYRHTSLAKREPEIIQDVAQSKRVEFTQGAPESYLYYYYMRQKGVNVY